jgi:hypothetical protein
LAGTGQVTATAGTARGLTSEAGQPSGRRRTTSAPDITPAASAEPTISRAHRPATAAADTADSTDVRSRLRQFTWG